MGVAIITDKRWKRLRDSIDFARRTMRPFRENRLDAIKQYVGTYYSDNGSATRVPVNLLALMVNILIRQLAARRPRVSISSEYPELSPQAWDFEIATNATLERIRFGQTMRQCVLDALFCQGVMKIGLYEDAVADVADMQFQGFHPFGRCVDLDDWVIDMFGRHWDRASFMGDRFRAPYEAVMNSPVYLKAAKDKLTPTVRNPYNEEGDDRVETIGNDTSIDPDEYREHVELWDIYLPSENLIVTLPAEGHGPPLRVEEWSGPHRGPYRRLGFIDVPNSAMKMGPVSMLKDLHLLANQLYRKLASAGVDEKTILAVMAEAADDAKTIIDAGDGDVVNVTHPDKIKEFHFRGVDNVALAFALDVIQKFSYFAGNLDVLGGLGVQADTATQEQLLSNSASTQVQDMQAATTEFARDCCEAIAHLLYTDPLIELPLSRRIPGFEQFNERFVWTPEHRVGEFMHYNFEINPYSMRDKTPQQQISTILSFIAQVYQPNIAEAQAQGVALNFEGLSRTFARLSDMDELEQVFTFSGPPNALRRGPVGDAPAKPSVTKRINERINRPGASNPGKQEAMMQLLLGSKLQNSQRSGISRPVG